MEKIFVKNDFGEKLSCIFEKIKEKSDKLVIFCHGFGGNKDYILFKKLSKEFNKIGFDCARFDFSGNGESEGKFGESGLIKEKKDLIKIIQHFKEYNNITLIGHSMGGAVSLITANEYKKIKNLVLINPLVLPSITFRDSLLKIAPPVLLSEFNHNHENNKLSKKIIKNKRFIFKKILDKISLDKSFYEQAIKTNVIEAAQKIKKPILIIHGKHDVIIPFSHQDYLYHQANKPKKIVTINFDHNPYTDKDVKNIKKEIIEFIFH